MVRYYGCAECGRSWRVERDLDVEGWPSAALISLRVRPTAPDAAAVARVATPITLRTWDRLNAPIAWSALTALARSITRSMGATW